MAHAGSYELIRSRKRKKTITLTVKRDGKIVIYAPFQTPMAEIAGFFESKKAWVRNKLAQQERCNTAEGREKQFVQGELFLYLGDFYPLEICDTNGSHQPLVLSHGIFLLHGDKAETAKEHFVRWYRKRAGEVIAERLGHWSRRLELAPEGITITSAQHRYGSCSSKNRLSFSWRIIMAPYEVIDYVIVHELAHIKEKNHSYRFWGLVEAIFPDYKKQRKWLRENNHLMRV
ncbi:MAG: WLM domain protein [Syntrophorhabdus sp. PtaU1.Bin153]|nr:MAG: WLM domain protein [Syntrophorhabdus sp. PtaU1.Bin153]